MIKSNPIKDKTAIAGVGTSEYTRSSGGRSAQALAIEACKKAILDAGLTAGDIDGVCGGEPHKMQAALGIPEITWWASPSIPIAFPLVAAMNAVYSGACEVALVYHSVYRHPGISRQAAQDPFRNHLTRGAAAGYTGPGPDSVGGVMGYPVWASRYMHEFDCKREHLGLVAINSRTNATMNEHAVLRTPLDMGGYLDGRMIREPLCIFDMDIPIDGADAFIVVSAERAKDLPKKPVLIHSATFGQTEYADEEQTTDIHHTGQNVVVPALMGKSDIALEDMDIFFPYDGFTIITLLWFENIGYCGKGEAGPFLEDNWDAAENRIRINGKVLVNTHGGSLSEGGTQGAGHLREAVVQLRGEAGKRQAPDLKTALLTPGGFFFNAQGIILRTD